LPILGVIDAFTFVGWAVAVFAIYIASYYLLLYFESQSGDQKNRRRPHVTLAVPAYNEGDNIYRALESLKNQKYPKRRIHVRVVDDGSTDDTAREVRRFIREHPGMDVKLLRNSRNRGKAHSLNKVLKQAETPFMVTMDADSEAHPEALANLVEYSKGVSVVTPCVLPADKQGVFQRIQAIEYIYGNYLANLLSGFDAQIVAPGPFSMFRVSALRGIGGFDEKSVAEDLEVVFRLRKAGHSLRLSPRAYVYTDIPSKLGDFVKQRRRWRAGFIDAVQKHPDSVTPFSEFGRQNLLNAGYIALTLAMAVAIIRRLWIALEPAVDVLRYVGWDILPYLRNLKLSFDYLGLDMQMTFYGLVMLALTVMFIYLASKFHGRRLNVLDTSLFVFAYGAAVTTATLLAIYSWVRGEYSW
jgi:cellulose synthase/poly-beta-1,6-N-acetylglucosamine synthase-like glycosyltransferase